MATAQPQRLSTELVSAKGREPGAGEMAQMHFNGTKLFNSNVRYTIVGATMFLRALIAFLALPGVVAGLVPVLLIYSNGARTGGWTFGFVFLGIGFVLLLWCVRDFFVSGRGTLAPWDPPKHLVIVGLYRLVRNPMYIAVVTMVIGWSVVAGSRMLVWYAASLAVGFHLRVLYFEELWLSRQFGAEWKDYSSSVDRWLPRLRPWSSDKRS